MTSDVMGWKECCETHYDSFRDLEDEGVKDRKREYRKRLIGYWIEARRTSGNRELRPSALRSMQELHDRYPEDSMMIINFTNRNRVQIKIDIEREEYYALGIEILGLKSVISEWKKQENRPETRDSLEMLIQQNEELYSNAEYMITAIIHRVRRLRKGIGKNPTNLKLTDGMLDVAEGLLLKCSGRARQHATLPNEKIRSLVVMQRQLNISRRAISKSEVDDLVEFADDLRKMSTEGEYRDYPGVKVYYWWALRIRYSRARTNLEFKEARDLRRKMNEVYQGMDDKLAAYCKCIMIGGEKGIIRDKEVADYHRALAKFIKNPKKEVNSKKDIAKSKHLLYRASLHKEATGNTPLFMWPETTPVDKLIDRCRKSILNAKVCIRSVSYRGLASKQATLFLLSIDLIIRIRWFLSVSRIYDKRQDSGTDRRDFDGRSEMEVAKELKEGIIHVLEMTKSQAHEGGEMQDLIVNWIESLKKLDFCDSENYSQTGTKFRGPLGQLCDFCGKAVGWEWEKITSVESKEWDGDDTLSLYGFEEGGRERRTSPELTIRTEGEENNPYIRQTGESSSILQ